MKSREQFVALIGVLLLFANCQKESSATHISHRNAGDVGPVVDLPTVDIPEPTESPGTDPGQQGPSGVSVNPSASPATGGPQSGTVSGSGCSNAIALPDVPANSGQLLFSISDTAIDPCSLQAELVGGSSALALSPLKDGRFLINNIPGGNYDVILKAASAGANLQGTGISQGIRINDIRVENGRRTDRPGVALGALGNIVGIAQLEGQADHSGIEVEIRGTSFSATTDSQGNFTIFGVVPGTHDLTYDNSVENYGEGHARQVFVANGNGAATAPLVILTLKELGADGGIVLAGDSPVQTSRQVAFFVFATGEPQLMQVSHSPFFENVPFESFRSSGTYTFPVDEELRNGGKGSKTLYVKLQENALTYIRWTQVNIDLFKSVNDHIDAGNPIVELANGANTVNGQLNTFVKVFVPDTASGYQISSNSQFNDSAWASDVPDATSAERIITRSVSLKPGDSTIYVRFRTTEGVLSETYSDTVTVQLFPAGSVSFNIDHPNIDAVYNPSFTLQNIVHPLQNPGKILIATNPEFDNAVELDTASTTSGSYTWDFADDRSGSVCGDHTFYLKVLDLESGLESDMVTKQVRYNCFNAISDNGAGSSLRRVYASVNNYENGFILFSGQIRTTINGSEFHTNTSTGAIYNNNAREWEAIRSDDLPAGDIVYSADFTEVIGNHYYVVTDNGQIFSYDLASRKSNDVGINRWHQAQLKFRPDISIAGPNYIFMFSKNNDAALFDTTKQLLIDLPLAPIGESFNSLPQILAGNRYIYIMGGELSNNAGEAKGIFLDLENLTWNSMAGEHQEGTAISVRTNQFMAEYNNKLLVWGGSSDVSLASTLKQPGIFDPSSNTWEILPDFKTLERKDRTFSTVYGDKYYVFGFDTDKWYGYIFDFTTKQWSEFPITNFPNPPSAESVFDYKIVPTSHGFTLLSSPESQDGASPIGGYLVNFDFISGKWTPFYKNVAGLPASELQKSLFYGASSGSNASWFGGRKVYNDGSKEYFANGYEFYHYRHPITLHSFNLNGSGHKEIQAGQTVGVGFTASNRQLPLNDVTVTAKISGPASLSAATLDLGKVEAMEERVVDPENGLQITVNPDAQYGDSIKIELSYTSAEGYAASFTAQYVVKSIALRVSNINYPANGTSAGSVSTFQIELNNPSGSDLTNGPVSVEVGNCVESVSSPQTEISVADGNYTQVEVTATMGSNCEALDQAGFVIVIDTGSRAIRIPISFNFGTTIFRKVGGYGTSVEDIFSEDRSIPVDVTAMGSTIRQSIEVDFQSAVADTDSSAIGMWITYPSGSYYSLPYTYTGDKRESYVFKKEKVWTPGSGPEANGEWLLEFNAYYSDDTFFVTRYIFEVEMLTPVE